MEEPNITVAERQLKGRRTSLGKKTNEELIDIILRKDKTERNNNAKIKMLTDANFEYAKRIDNFVADMAGMEDKLKTKQEIIDSCRSTISDNLDKLDSKNKEIGLLKKNNRTLINVVIVLVCVTVVSLVLAVLGF